MLSGTNAVGSEPGHEQSEEESTNGGDDEVNLDASASGEHRELSEYIITPPKTQSLF